MRKYIISKAYAVAALFLVFTTAACVHDDAAPLVSAMAVNRPVTAPAQARGPVAIRRGGDASGIGGVAPKMTLTAKQAAGIVASEFKKAGASDEAIAGMMANIQDESGFNAANRHFDQPRFQGTEAAFGHGLWQMGGTEWNRYAGWLKTNAPNGNWADPTLQARWQVENIQNNYKNLWKKMQTHAPASEQAAAFVADYENPEARYLAQRQAKYLGGVPGLSAYTDGDMGAAVDSTEGSQMSTDFGGLKFKDPRENVAGGPANKAIIDLAKHVQETEPSFVAITALNDNYHHRLYYHSAHTDGRAFDIALADVGGSQKRARYYLNSLGLKEGGQRSGDFWIEPSSMDDTHLHIQFNNQGADRYWAATHRAAARAQRPRLARSRASPYRSTAPRASERAGSATRCVTAARVRDGMRDRVRDGCGGRKQPTWTNAPLVRAGTNTVGTTSG